MASRMVTKLVSKNIQRCYCFVVIVAIVMTISCLVSLIQTDEQWGNAYNAVVSRLSVPESTRSWREKDGVIYFSVKSDGTIGEEWITRFEENGFRVNYEAKQVLRSPSFVPTSGVTYEVAVLKGTLFEDNTRAIYDVRARAKAFRTPDGRKLYAPNAELACLIRDKFTDEELEAMGLWYIVAMHELINVNGVPSLLFAGHSGGARWLIAYYGYGRPRSGWERGGGFAFVLSPASAEATVGK